MSDKPSRKNAAIPSSITGQSAAHTAIYIGEMSGELAKLAKTTGFGVLAYLLEMSRAEAMAASANGEQVKREG